MSGCVFGLSCPGYCCCTMEQRNFRTSAGRLDKAVFFKQCSKGCFFSYPDHWNTDEPIKLFLTCTSSGFCWVLPLCTWRHALQKATHSAMKDIKTTYCIYSCKAYHKNTVGSLKSLLFSWFHCKNGHRVLLVKYNQIPHYGEDTHLIISNHVQKTTGKHLDFCTLCLLWSNSKLMQIWSN